MKKTTSVSCLDQIDAIKQWITAHDRVGCTKRKKCKAHACKKCGARKKKFCDCCNVKDKRRIEGEWHVEMDDGVMQPQQPIGPTTGTLGNFSSRRTWGGERHVGQKNDEEGKKCFRERQDACWNGIRTMEEECDRADEEKDKTLTTYRLTLEAKEKEIKRLRRIIKKAYSVGFNGDCMFCGFKDKILKDL